MDRPEPLWGIVNDGQRIQKKEVLRETQLQAWYPKVWEVGGRKGEKVLIKAIKASQAEFDMTQLHIFFFFFAGMLELGEWD